MPNCHKLGALPHTAQLGNEIERPIDKELFPRTLCWGGGAKSKNFWPTVKPFLSNNGLLKDPVIIISEDSTIISDQTSVAGILNDFYVNVANDIGTKLTPKDTETHPSVKTINETVVCSVFSFKPTTAVSIHALIGKSSSKKATGV